MNEIWDAHERRLVRTVVRAAGRIAGRAATLNGARKPVAWLEDEFFAAMSDEIEASGVKRRISAEMFGASRRTFQRRLSAVHARLGEIGNSLWWQVYDVLGDAPMSAEAVLGKFSRRPPDVIEAILRDMESSGWIVEHDGSFVTCVEDNPWTRERLEQFANAIALFDSERSVDRLARYSGVDADTVREWLGELDSFGRVLDAQAEAKWLVLSSMAEAALSMIFQRLAGSSGGDGRLWRCVYAAEQASDVQELRNLLQTKGDEIDEGYHEFVNGMSAGTSAPATATYVMMLIEADQSHTGWQDL